MNNQNLIPNSQRTREELQEMGRKGGIKSGEVRRRKREFQRIAGQVLVMMSEGVLTDLAAWMGGKKE